MSNQSIYDNDFENKQYFQNSKLQLYNTSLSDIYKNKNNVIIFRNYNLDTLYDNNYKKYYKIMTYYENDIENNIEIKFLTNTLLHFQYIDITTYWKIQYPIITKMYECNKYISQLIDYSNEKYLTYNNILTTFYNIKPQLIIFNLINHNYEYIDKEHLSFINNIIKKINNNMIINNNLINYNVIKSSNIIEKQHSNIIKEELNNIMLLFENNKNIFNKIYFDCECKNNIIVKCKYCDGSVLTPNEIKKYNIDKVYSHFDMITNNVCKIIDINSINSNFWKEWEINNEQLHKQILNNYLKYI